METAEASNVTKETIYTPIEIAKAHKLGITKVRELFRDEPGVIKLGRQAAGVSRRQPYSTLRIPASVVQRVFKRMTVGA